MTETIVEARVEGGRPEWLSREEFPFRSRWLAVAGTKVHYLDEGEGPTMVFVHGGPAWLFVWRDVLRVLRSEFRCVAVDLPGAGLSAAPVDGGATLPAMAEAVAGVVSALDVRDAVLVVQDVGGPVALAAAVREPERWSGLVVSGSFAWPLTRTNPEVVRMLRFVGSRPFRLVNRWTNLLARLTSTSAGVGRRLSREGRRAFRGPFRDAWRRDHAVRLLGDVVRRERFLAELEAALRAHLAELPAPLLFGEADPGRKAGFEDRFAELLPRSRRRVVAGAHHFPQAEAPEEVAESIRAWYAAEVSAPRASRGRP
ncbi:MAG: alpha/beta fold hydrolase [Gemmatimonadota bacterium]